MSSSGKKEKNQPIQVFLRVRPLNKQERASGSYNVVEIPSSKEVTIKQHLQDKYTKKFTFDKVFGPQSHQEEIFKTVVSPLIDEVLAGYNCTVFAYGQTGTGKTYTMAGGSQAEYNPDCGIIPRSLNQLFDTLRAQEVEHTVRVSYLELYNEELFDLLSTTDDSSKIRLYEDSTKKGSVIISGLEEISVRDKYEVFKVLDKGTEKRRTAATLMNAQSSRSHTVFSITVHMKENTADGEELLKTGKINLVDLAGSENIGRSGAVDKRAREAGNINQSLLTLGRVITALVEHAPHVPYRESKLTRLLQDSLGGRTKTSIVATISPAVCNVEETLSTLDYAHRARNITNRPEINQRMTKVALLKQYTEEIDMLKRDLAATRACNGVYVAPENYDKMLRDLHAQMQLITEKVNEITALKDEHSKLEDICKQLKMSLVEKENFIENQTKILNDTDEKLRKTKIECSANKFLMERHLETEKKLSEQAKALLGVAEISSNDTYKLHDVLTKRKAIENDNLSTVEMFRQDFTSNLSEMKNQIHVFSKDQLKFIDDAAGKLLYNTEKHLNLLKHSDQLISDFIKSKKHLNDLMQANNEKQLFVNNELCKKCDDTIKNSVEEGFNNRNEFLTNQLLVNIENLKINTKYFTEKLEENKIMWKNILIQMYSDNQNFISKLMNEQKTNQHILLEIIKDKQAEFDKLHSAIEVKKKEKEQFQKMLETFFSSSIDFIKRDNEFDKEIYTEFKTSSSTIEENLMSVRNGINNTVKESLKYESACTENKIANDETTTAKFNEMVESSKKSTFILNNIVDITNENIQHNRELTNSNIQSIQSCLGEYKNEIEKSVNEDLSLLANSFECLSKFKNTNKENFLLANDSLNTLSDSMKYNITVVKQNCNEFSKKMLDEIESRNIEVSTLIDKEIVQYQPSGETPIRKQFRYPKYLASTSPHARLLERFYSRVPNGEFDKSTDSDSINATDTNMILSENILRRTVSVNDLVDYKSNESNSSDDFKQSSKENVQKKSELKRSMTEVVKQMEPVKLEQKLTRRILKEKN